MGHKVLILSASAGAGHVSAGKALEHAFRAQPHSASVQHLDTLDYTNPMFQRLYCIRPAVHTWKVA